MRGEVQHFLIKLIYVRKFRMSTLLLAEPVGEQWESRTSHTGWCMGSQWWERRHGLRSLTRAQGRFGFLAPACWALPACLGWAVCDGDAATGGEHQHLRGCGSACQVLPSADAWC